MGHRSEIRAVCFQYNSIESYLRQHFVEAAVFKRHYATDAQIEIHLNDFLCLFNRTGEAMKNPCKIFAGKWLQQCDRFIDRFPTVYYQRQSVLLSELNLYFKCFLLLRPKCFIPI